MPEIRTLLLTDVVDSTKLTETLGDAAAADAGAAHDRVARDLLRRWRGREIDKTDGMLMLFDDVADAVGCALAYHRAIAVLPVPLQARAGIHVGPVTLRANPPQDVAHGAKPVEVEGLAKPVAARIMTLARGGQTLLSAEARAALGNGTHCVQSHGHWRIKGVAEPIELFEVGDDGAPFTPPPDADKVYRVVRQGELWMPRREVRHSLPAERDAFVGRQEALAELARRFDRGARLVSVLGIGGVGKTRLAVRFGWTWLGDFPGGVWFCDLSQARDVEGILRAVAQGLGVPLGADDPLMQIGHAIGGRGACLVILDNFEQVARHAAAALGRWLDRAPEARYLVTTREILGLPGEEALPLAPLEASDAQLLFECRAAAAAPQGVGALDKAAIAALVDLLDGLPLAIELAAARVRVMTPRTLLARMGRRFKLLATLGGRNDRQATLRAAFDWSWDLLNDAERAALAQLSAFEGGFTLQAAEAVLDPTPGGGDAEVLDLLASLVDKSFVRRSSESRFDLLVSVREYAGEQLRAREPGPGRGSAVALTIERRHCAYFAELAGTDPSLAIDEVANLVAACRRAAAFDDARLAARVLESAWAVLELRGPFRLGLELAEMLLPPTVGTVHEARVRSIAGRAAWTCGKRADARDHLEAALRTPASPQGERATVCAECDLGALLAEDGRLDEARARHDRAMRRALEIGDDELLCRVCNEAGILSMSRGEFVQAHEHFERALRVARETGRLRWEGGFLGNLGYLADELGRPAEAESRYAEALAIARRVGDLKFSGNTLSNLGLLEHWRGRADAARAHFDEALSIARRIGHRRLEAVVLCNLGLHLDSVGRAEDALRHLDGAVAVCRELGDPGPTGQCLGYLGLIHARLGDRERARDCIDEGERLLRGQSDPVSLAVLLCASAEVEYLGGRRTQLARRLAEASALARTVGSGAESELGRALQRVRQLVAA